MNATAEPASGKIPPCPEFDRQLARWQARVESELDARLPPVQVQPARLHSALRYCVLGGGKRIRPALAYATAGALGLEESQVDGVACAVELIHAYSLIHDDLPAMDDDDLRRGRPTCHKAFDEATAILAGDALQVLAFQGLASGPGLPPNAEVRLELVRLLAIASGSDGMAGGQALDLAAAGRELSAAEVEEMHRRKTGALIRAAVQMAACCAPGRSPDAQAALDRYASDLGLAFQIQDDLLDIEGDERLLGKTTGADRAHHKPTYPAVVGIDAARQRMHELHRGARQALEALGEPAAALAALSDWLVLRRH